MSSGADPPDFWRLGAEEGLISGGFSEEYQTMCF